MYHEHGISTRVVAFGVNVVGRGEGCIHDEAGVEAEKLGGVMAGREGR